MNNPDAVDAMLADLPEVITAEEVGSMLRVTPVTVTKWARQGNLTAIRVGKRMLRIRKEDLREFLLTADEAEGSVDNTDNENS